MNRANDPPENAEECEFLHPRTITARIVSTNGLPDKLATHFGSKASANGEGGEKKLEKELEGCVVETGLSGKAIRMQVS